MLVLKTPADFASHVGADLGVTEWRAITQQQISTFATLTSDDHWIHVDEARAAKDLPGGRTLAHGLFVLSLIPAMQRGLFRVEQRGAGLFCGYDKVRFILPVPVGARIRLRQSITTAERRRLGTRIGLRSEIELDDPGMTAIVAEGLLLISDA